MSDDNHPPGHDRRQRKVHEYDIFLRGKIEAARRSMRSGEGRDNDAVEAEFAARRLSIGGRA